MRYISIESLRVRVFLMYTIPMSSRAAPTALTNYFGEIIDDKCKQLLPRATSREQLVLFAIGNRRVYGLDIKKHIEQSTGGRQTMSVGALYPILQSLENKGLIESEWGDETTCGARRRYHRCSELGKAVIDDVLSTQQRLLSSGTGQMSENMDSQ